MHRCLCANCWNHRDLSGRTVKFMDAQANEIENWCICVSRSWSLRCAFCRRAWWPKKVRVQLLQCNAIDRVCACALINFMLLDFSYVASRHCCTAANDAVKHWGDDTSVSPSALLSAFASLVRHLNPPLRRLSWPYMRRATWIATEPLHSKVYAMQTYGMWRINRSQRDACDRRSKHDAFFSSIYSFYFRKMFAVNCD